MTTQSFKELTVDLLNLQWLFRNYRGITQTDTDIAKKKPSFPKTIIPAWSDALVATAKALQKMVYLSEKAAEEANDPSLKDFQSGFADYNAVPKYDAWFFQTYAYVIRKNAVMTSMLESVDNITQNLTVMSKFSGAPTPAFKKMSEDLQIEFWSKNEQDIEEALLLLNDAIVASSSLTKIIREFEEYVDAPASSRELLAFGVNELGLVADEGWL